MAMPSSSCVAGEIGEMRGEMAAGATVVGLGGGKSSPVLLEFSDSECIRMIARYCQPVLAMPMTQIIWVKSQWQWGTNPQRLIRSASIGTSFNLSFPSARCGWDSRGPGPKKTRRWRLASTTGAVFKPLRLSCGSPLRRVPRGPDRPFRLPQSGAGQRVPW